MIEILVIEFAAERFDTARDILVRNGRTPQRGVPTTLFAPKRQTRPIVMPVSERRGRRAK